MKTIFGQDKEKMNHFKDKNESYKHNAAKEVLCEWIKPDWLRVDIESSFSLKGIIEFRPDLTCYSENGIQCIYEVCHKNPISWTKKRTIKRYQYITGIYFDVFEVNADYILNQIKRPKKLEVINHKMPFGAMPKGDIEF